MLNVFLSPEESEDNRTGEFGVFALHREDGDKAVGVASSPTSKQMEEGLIVFGGTPNQIRELGMAISLAADILDAGKIPVKSIAVMHHVKDSPDDTSHGVILEVMADPASMSAN